MKVRMLGTIAFATALVAGGAFAQEIESKAGMPPGNMQMMAMHNQMMAKMMGMHEPVMKDMKDMKDMKGMKDDKSPDSHKEHHE